ncbi:hypothetical protein LMG27174_01488 [Paraburkholderia rhynchosiae]|uniref:Uncharacterized protein n=1 Tax=Paraburkholderia rhynchosiae TaxID=487049 RepID=A0A6J5AG32_9BURK|nr:hypothetical protein LMG27174_01488 [Paraburkholderia rhynchosiae]
MARTQGDATNDLEFANGFVGAAGISAPRAKVARRHPPARTDVTSRSLANHEGPGRDQE